MASRPRSAKRRTPSPKESTPRVEGRVRAARVERGLSQAQLAEAAGLTRQAVYSIESNHYLPNVTIALRLAHTLGQRVEDLFRLDAAGAVVEADLLGGRDKLSTTPRAKVWSVGERTFALPVASLGASLTYSTPADGLIVGPAARSGRAHAR